MATKAKYGAASKTTHKIPVVCTDGPMWGEILYLSDTDKSTAIFTYRGQTGRYVGGEWQSVC